MAGVVGIPLVVGLVLLILKWALITAAILALPFGAWWIYDRVSAGRRRAAEQDRVAGAWQRRADLV